MKRNKFESKLVALNADELMRVSGGILQQEGLYPRKPGDKEFLVYVDGVLMGTAYGNASGGTFTDHGLGGPFHGTINGRWFP